ncbi:DMT family transporter [Snodgrassella sp. CFCC 13594]|uniref:DMT family transporter n=1 Tax=Snodgrassella sp. CFCC 13594 TaxID=1775559 RepID=UPI000829B8A8|nr:DMT family transporter [Snodgrassella sp. CFCC 13594]
MLFLLISVVCSVAVSVLLKVARSNNVDLAQAIAVNYPIAAVCAWYFLRPNIIQVATDWQHVALFAALGVLLPSVFVLMGKAVAAAGIVKADAAQRLSLFLPIVAAFVWFHETLTPNKVMGIVLAFVALLALLYHAPIMAKGKSSKGRSQGSMMAQAALLLGVWLGYGLIDILFKQMAKSGQVFGATLLVSFVLAGVLIFAWLLCKRTKWTAASILSGLLLGCLNFANILFYIRAHQAYSSNPALVFAGMNLGVIVLGTLIGGWVFKEKIHTINAAGIVLALAAIVCLFYWPTLQTMMPAWH